MTVRDPEDHDPVIALGAPKFSGTVTGCSQQMDFAAMVAIQFIRTMGTSRNSVTFHAHPEKEMVCNNCLTAATVPRGCPNASVFFKVGTSKMFTTSGHRIGKMEIVYMDYLGVYVETVKIYTTNTGSQHKQI